MAERLVQHKHCPQCGKAMSADRKTCSDECEVAHEAVMKEKKRTMYLFYGLAVVMIILFASQFW